MKLVYILLFLFTACAPLLEDQTAPLTPANEIWLHGYVQGHYDFCLGSLLAVQNQVAGMNEAARIAIEKECQRLADDIEIRARAKLYLQEHYPTPTPTVKLPPSSGV
jgi:hypothetical protein